jgi:hypothetical protein
MRNRIWYELVEAKFNSEYLSIYVDQLRRSKKRVDIFLISTSLLSIVGWYKTGGYSEVWASVLLGVQVVRILRNQIFITNEEIINLKSVLNFYINQTHSLEELWYKLDNKKINEKTARLQFSKLREKEELMRRIEKYNKVPDKKKLNKLADIETRKYLDRFN